MFAATLFPGLPQADSDSVVPENPLLTQHRLQQKLQQKQQKEEAAAKAAAAKEYAAKKGLVEEETEETVLSGDPARPYAKGRAYDPNRYRNTEE